MDIEGVVIKYHIPLDEELHSELKERKGEAEGEEEELWANVHQNSYSALQKKTVFLETFKGTNVNHSKKENKFYKYKLKF